MGVCVLCVSHRTPLSSVFTILTPPVNPHRFLSSLGPSFFLVSFCSCHHTKEASTTLSLLLLLLLTVVVVVVVVVVDGGGGGVLLWFAVLCCAVLDPHSHLLHPLPVRTSTVCCDMCVCPSIPPVRFFQFSVFVVFPFLDGWRLRLPFFGHPICYFHCGIFSVHGSFSVWVW